MRSERYFLPVILPLLIPSHLNSFEFAFVRLPRVILEVWKRKHGLMQIREADGERIGIGLGLVQRQPEIFGVEPGLANI